MSQINYSFYSTCRILLAVFIFCMFAYSTQAQTPLIWPSPDEEIPSFVLEAREGSVQVEHRAVLVSQAPSTANRSRRRSRTEAPRGGEQRRAAVGEALLRTGSGRRESRPPVPTPRPCGRGDTALPAPLQLVAEGWAATGGVAAAPRPDAEPAPPSRHSVDAATWRRLTGTGGATAAIGIQSARRV